MMTNTKMALCAVLLSIFMLFAIAPGIGAAQSESAAVCQSGVTCSTSGPTSIYVDSGTSVQVDGACTGCGTSGLNSYVIIYPEMTTCPNIAAGSNPAGFADCSTNILDIQNTPSSGCVVNGPNNAGNILWTFGTSDTSTGVLPDPGTACIYTQDGTGGAFYGSAVSVSVCGPNAQSACASGTGPPQLPAGVTQAICSVYFAVNTIVFILALTLMILGGALYGGSQILPGQSRGVIQGYAMGLIFGGVAGAIIAMVAPWLLSIVSQTTVSTILQACA